MKKFLISTENPYEVLIGEALLKDAGAYISTCIPPCHLCIITDSTVNSIYSQVIMDNILCAVTEEESVLASSDIERLKDKGADCTLVLGAITDSTVNSIYSQVIMTSLMEHGYRTSKVVFPAVIL